MLNKATLIGRVGKKEIKTLKNGGQLTAIALATTRRYKDSSGEKQIITTWHNINCFNKLGEIAEKYVNVGDLIYVEGEINNKKIEQGDKAGNWIYSLTANDIKFISRPNKKEPDTQKNENSNEQDFDDLIPF